MTRYKDSWRDHLSWMVLVALVWIGCVVYEGYQQVKRLWRTR